MAQNTINTPEVHVYSEKDFQKADRRISVTMIGILLIILAIFLVAFFLLKNRWENQRLNQAVQNQEEVKAQLDELWESQEYYRYAQYYAALGIERDSAGTFAEYRQRYEVSQNYELVNNEIMSLKITGLDLEEKTVTGNISELLIDFYISASEPEDQTIVSLMDETLENYFYVTEEELNTIHSSTDSSEIQKLLQGGLERGEEKEY